LRQTTLSEESSRRAASPGFTLLRFFGPVGVRGPDGRRLPDAGEGDPYVEKMPIVAWRIDESHAVPVTPDDDDDNLVGSGVLLPDGKVVVPFDATFDMARGINVFPALKDGDFCNQRRTFPPDT
jgi:hypothetical protein